MFILYREYICRALERDTLLSEKGTNIGPQGLHLSERVHFLGIHEIVRIVNSRSLAECFL